LAEFPASVAKFGFGENFAPDVPNKNIRSAVRFRYGSRRCGQRPLE
jgi:hypothetical protein